MLGERLREILNDRGISISEFSEMCDLPLETVKNIFYGKTTDPKVSTILQMSNALHMSVNELMGCYSNSKEERAVIQYYRTCGRHGKSIIELVAKYEAVTVKAERESLKKHKIPCLVPHGNINEGIIYDRCETVEIETAVDAAFTAIKVTTNDLVPVYFKGDIILLANYFPANGECGVFYKDTKSYIRKYIEEEGQYRLKCLHKTGKDIVVKSLDQIEYIGTCIGVLRT